MPTLSLQTLNAHIYRKGYLSTSHVYFHLTTYPFKGSQAHRFTCFLKFRLWVITQFHLSFVCNYRFTSQEFVDLCIQSPIMDIATVSSAEGDKWTLNSLMTSPFEALVVKVWLKWKTCCWRRHKETKHSPNLQGHSNRLKHRPRNIFSEKYFYFKSPF